MLNYILMVRHHTPYSNRTHAGRSSGSIDQSRSGTSSRSSQSSKKKNKSNNGRDRSWNGSRIRDAGDDMLHGAESAGNYIASTADKYGGKVKDGLSSVTNSVSGVLNGAKNSVDNLFSGVETLVIVGLIGGAMLLYKGGNAAVNNAPAAFHYVANNAPAAMRTAAEVAPLLLV